jgi:hypothetical protein
MAPPPPDARNLQRMLLFRLKKKLRKKKNPSEQDEMLKNRLQRQSPPDKYVALSALALHTKGKYSKKLR